MASGSTSTESGSGSAQLPSLHSSNASSQARGFPSSSTAEVQMHWLSTHLSPMPCVWQLLPHTPQFSTSEASIGSFRTQLSSPTEASSSPLPAGMAQALSMRAGKNLLIFMIFSPCWLLVVFQFLLPRQAYFLPASFFTVLLWRSCLLMLPCLTLLQIFLPRIKPP